jgi:DNA-directed RNA polymerase specialized sigma24 family protein
VTPHVWLSQEVYLAVLRHAATFDPARGSSRARLARIARTRVIKEMRRRGRRPRATSQPPEPPGANRPDPRPLATTKSRIRAGLKALRTRPAPLRMAS